MVKVELKLYTQKDPREDGSYPITYYIRYGGKPFFRRTGFYSTQKQWNSRDGNISKQHPGGQKLQMQLLRDMYDLQISLQEKEYAGVPFKMAYDQEVNPVPTFFTHFKTITADQLKTRDLGNREVYMANLKWLNTYFNNDILINKLDYTYAKKLLSVMDALGNSTSTISHRFRTFTAVYNDAQKRWPHEITGPAPFMPLIKGRGSRVTKQRDKHQPIEVVRELMNFTGTKSQQKAVHVWLMAFFLRGAGIVDMIYMEDLPEDYYDYNRLKMPKKDIRLKVKVLPVMRDIASMYKGKPYLFNLVKVPRNDNRIIEGDKPEGSRQYGNARNFIDKNLKKVSRQLGLKTPLSMVQARHSWIIAARDLGIPKEVIEQCVGHKGQSVMDRHYFGNYDQGILDEANARVVGIVFK